MIWLSFFVICVARLLTKREILIYCDLHGHSRKQNMFMYGCENRNRNQGKFLQERIFPLLLSKTVPDKVRLLSYWKHHTQNVFFFILFIFVWKKKWVIIFMLSTLNAKKDLQNISPSFLSTALRLYLLITVPIFSNHYHHFFFFF